MVSVEEIRNSLMMVVDPELGLNIVELGLIYEIKLENGKAIVKMTLTSPHCPYGSQLIGSAKAAVENVEGIVEARIELVFEPMWNLEMLSDEAKAKLSLIM